MKLNKAFQRLRCNGYFAVEDWACCQSCGWAEIDRFAADPDHAVFYHAQDAEQLDEAGSCYLAWRGNAEQICDILNNNGVKAEWDGRETGRILMDTTD